MLNLYYVVFVFVFVFVFYIQIFNKISDNLYLLIRFYVFNNIQICYIKENIAIYFTKIIFHEVNISLNKIFYI